MLTGDINKMKTGKGMIKAVRGTRDLLPPETALWNFVEATVRDVFRAYNFQEIRTPIFEATELFARGVGEETDIVRRKCTRGKIAARADSEKGQSLTLRPEEYCWCRAGLHRTQALGSRAEQALLHRAAVSPGAAAKGAVPAVLSDRGGGDWAAVGRERVSGAGCGSAGDAGDVARPARHHAIGNWN